MNCHHFTTADIFHIKSLHLSAPTIGNMEIQTDQGLLVVNLDNCITNAALQQIAKGDCIYTLAVASGDDSSTMVQIPVTLQCNGNMQHSFGSVAELQQETFDQVNIAEQLQCLLERGDQISQIQLEPLKLQSDSLLDPNIPVSVNHNSYENILAEPTVSGVVNEVPAMLIDYNTIYDYVHTGTVPSGASEKYIKVLKKRSQHYSIINNVLYYGEKKLKKVISDKITQQEILRSYHVQKESGIHLGVRKMHSAIVSTFFWQELYMDVTKFVRQCEGCSEAAVEKHIDETDRSQLDVNTTAQEGNAPECVNLPVAEPQPLVWRSVEAQLHGPFITTNRLNEYILTLSDPVSHWITALPVPDNNLASRMANFLFETFCVFGFTKCNVVSLSYKQFDAIQRRYKERISQVKDMKSKLSRKGAGNSDCQFAHQLIDSITSSNPANWDLEQEQFLYKYRTTALDGGRSPFDMMFNRKPNRTVEDEKENEGNDLSGDESQHQYTSKRRRLQCSILQCRHCEDVYTSKISFRIHQRKHMEDARRRGTLEGQEPLGSSGVAEKKLARSKALKKKQKLIRRHSQGQAENSNRIDRLLLMMNRINSQRLNKQQVVPKGGHHEEMKANTVAAVKEILASTKEVRRRRGKYQKYPAELQEEMARYAIEHGNYEAVQHFTEKLGTSVSDSTIRNLVKLQRSFTPEIKEEIGRYAAAYGVEATSALFTKRLGYEVRHGIVKKFKKQYTKHYPEVSQKVLTKCSNALPSVASALNSKKKVAYSAEVRDEIGCYSTQFTIAETLQHFANRLNPPLKKGTVRKFRKMYLEKHKPVVNTSIQDSNVQQQAHLNLQDTLGPTTSQTIDILNASLNILNNQQMNAVPSNQTIDILNASLNLLNNTPMNPQSTVIYNHLPQSGANLMSTPIRFFSNTTVPTTVPTPYLRQHNPITSSSSQNDSQFNHNMNNMQTFHHAQNDYLPLGQLQKHDSLTNTVLLQPLSQNSHHLVYSTSSLQTQQMPTLTLARSQPEQTYVQNASESLLLSSCNMSLTQDKYDSQDYNPNDDESMLQNNMPAEMVENLQDTSFTHSLPTLIADRDGTYTLSSDINDDDPVTVHDQDSLFESEPLAEMLDEDLSEKDLPHQNPMEHIQLRSNRKKVKPASLREVALECSSALEEDVDDPMNLGTEETPSPKCTKRKKRAKRKAGNKKDKPGKRGSYTAYSPEIRAEMGKYAAEHGSQCASVHFRALLGHDVPESTVRGLRDKYLLKREQMSGRLKTGSEVTSLGYSPRGRPMRLGKYDAVVQDCLRELVKSGEKVSSFLAIATAKQVLTQYEPGLLEENGGSTKLNVTWAKSFLKRIGVHNNS